MRIYCSMVEIVVCVENTSLAIVQHAPHRCTAITVGALRTHPTRGPLVTDPFLQTQGNASLLYSH
jgi:hypothetical protein